MLKISWKGLKKPKKLFVKLWVLCESLSSYCLQFEIYTGKVDVIEHGLSQHYLCMHFVMHMLKISWKDLKKLKKAWCETVGAFVNLLLAHSLEGGSSTLSPPLLFTAPTAGPSYPHIFKMFSPPLFSVPLPFISHSSPTLTQPPPALIRPTNLPCFKQISKG